MEALQLRPETAADDFVLRSIYASTREAELAQTGWPPAQCEAFLRMQFDAQRFHYRNYYADACFDLIELDGEVAGRFYTWRGPRDIRVIDIALLPPFRGRGIGTHLLSVLQHEAAAAGTSVSIHVEQNNPAQHLYHRLGFRKVQENGIYWLMAWTAQSTTEAQPAQAAV